MSAALRFARVLLERSTQTLLTARLSLQSGDAYSAISRAYYAAFYIARAAILTQVSSGKELPRTHNGVAHVFRQYALASGLDEATAAVLSRLEELRLLADYAEKRLDSKLVSDAITTAQKFIDAVERGFDLGRLLTEPGAQVRPDDTVEESDFQNEWPDARNLDLPASAFDEERRQARENWARLRADRAHAADARCEVARAADSLRRPRTP